MGDKTADRRVHVEVGGKLQFHYQKTQQYRVYHSDGCVGGPTPRGQLSLTFFSERTPIPKLGARQILDVTGAQITAGPEEAVEVLSGLVRQIEATVMMDLRAAQEFYVFLGEQLALMESSMGVNETERVTKAHD
jgi:hypothetical protein